MTILPIRIAPDPVLYEIAKPVAEVTDAHRTLMDDMLETMYHNNGVGLAAPQVGVSERILVMDIAAGSERYEDIPNGEPNPLFFVNPEIIQSSDTVKKFEEGCLSFPGQFAEIERPDTVTLRFLDYDGNPQEMEMDKIMSVCIQHEIDHLNGIVFVDYVSKLKRNRIMTRLEKYKKRLLG